MISGARPADAPAGDIDAGARAPIDRAVIGALVVGLVACALLIAAPQREDYWAALVAIVGFAVAPVFLPSVRVRLDTPLCPLNWALIVFFFHLVVDSLLVAYQGPFVNTLPSLPGPQAVNVALIVSTVAWIAFAVGCEIAPRVRLGAPRVVRSLLARPRPQVGTNRLALAFAVLGVIGLALAFHSPAQVVDYFHAAGSHSGAENDADLSGPVRSASVALRPFLAFALIAIWCRWIDERAPGQRLLGRTVLTAVLVMASSATYSYNRAALVAPVIGMAAVYGARVMRMRVWALVLIAVLALGALTISRSYRNTDYTVTQLVTDSSARHAVLSSADLSREVQIYTSSPQYLGYLLAETGYGTDPHYGRTLVSSALYPVPQVGKPFRDTSGVRIYNRLIYGQSSSVTDQIVPFEGELFLDYALAGVGAGYLLLGWAVARVQRGFERARDAFTVFAWQYGAVWLAFLVVGSIAVFSQIALYFFWPVLVYALLRDRPERPAAQAS